MAKMKIMKTAPAWMREGALADYHAKIGGPVTHPGCRVLSEPWKLGHGAWVVKIEGVSGGVAIEALTEAAHA